MSFGWPSHRHRLLGSLALATALLNVPAIGLAGAPSVERVAKAKASGGQPELSVGFDAQGRLRARVANGTTKSSETGTLEQGTLLAVPDSVLSRRDQSTLRIVPLGEQRHAIVVSIPTESATRTWQALILAKPGQLEPEVLFAGFTGYVEGEDGLRHGPVLDVSAAIDDLGTRRIVLGETREELTLCGRPATLSPKMLAPKDLAFKPAKLQRLSAEEREHALTLTAEPHAEPTTSAVTASSAVTATAQTQPPATPTAAPVTGPVPAVAQAPASPRPSPNLLRALGASSAIGWPVALTDGDPETTWAENRGGAGRGEFVTFRAPSDVPLQGFDFVIKPGQRAIPKGAGPNQLWLVTANQVYAVNFPSDPWKAPLVRWQVKLPTPVQTDCVAVVSESAYAEKPDSEVTFAEIRATSEFANTSIDQLVGALAGGGPRAESASTILSALGPDAFRAVAKAFASFDEGGKRVALDVLDHAPCSESSETYLFALLGKVEAHRMHALDRLRRCGPDTASVIERVLGAAPKLEQRPILELYAEIAPDRLIAYVAPRISGSPKLRRMLRDVLGQASRSAKAEPALAEQLSRNDLPQSVYVEMLRATGPKLAPFAATVAARIDQLLATEPDWKTRYLVLAPAHQLTPSNPALTERISSLIKNDPNPYVRIEAIRAMIQVEPFTSVLLATAADPEMRVRQAATERLANSKHPSADEILRTRLTQDTWPEVRAQAAESLAAQPSTPKGDEALLDALDDDSWLVRVKVAEALGARHSFASGEALVDRFEDRKERVEVRVAAANSLAILCYDPGVEPLTEQAKKLKSPGMDLRERALSASALDALGRIHPNDLEKRLAPLLTGKDVPKEVVQAAKSALVSETSCHPKPAVVEAKLHSQ